MAQSWADTFASILQDGEDPGLPPGTPPMRESLPSPIRVCQPSDVVDTEKFEGPWFTTQLTLSASIGLTSFFLFSYCRTRWPLLFAPRTKLKG